MSGFGIFLSNFKDIIVSDLIILLEFAFMIIVRRII